MGKEFFFNNEKIEITAFESLKLAKTIFFKVRKEASLEYNKAIENFSLASINYVETSKLFSK